MKRTRVFGGLLAASTAFVGAVLFCLPASARQTGLTPVEPPLAPTPSALLPVSQIPIRQTANPAGPGPIQQATLSQAWSGTGPIPPPLLVEQAGMNCTCVPSTPVPVGTTAAVTENKPTSPKDATVDELIARSAELKAKEAELTDVLRAKLLMQKNGLKKLQKLGVRIEEEYPVPVGPAQADVTPSLRPAPPS